MFENGLDEIAALEPYSLFNDDKTAQLIILGNGFDLACGLKSRYSDFFNSKFSEYLAIDPSRGHVYAQLHELLGDLHLKETTERGFPRVFFDTQAVALVHNIWDLIFAYKCSLKCPHTWADVEATIKAWINNLGLTRMVSILQSDDPLRKFHASKERMEAYRTFVAYMFTRGFCDSKHVEFKDIQKFMLDELHVFEDGFAKYLNDSINDEYKRHASKLYGDLSLQDLPDITGERVSFNDVKDSVLSFNYTRPFDVSGPHWNTYRNIHGNIENGHIIFGIDSLDKDRKTLLTNDAIAPFTKTYRIMKNAHPFPHHLFDGAHFVSPMNASASSVDVIKIFGHSLAPADYSYFQSIFDQVNLYASDVVLIFYYMKHEEFNLERYYKSVVKLLSRYSTSLSNPDHGKNLIHKLILEDRLSVRELKVS